MTEDREQFLQALVCDLADARTLAAIRLSRFRDAAENEGLTDLAVRQLITRATLNQPTRRARLQDFLRPQDPTETPRTSAVAPSSGVDEPAPGCTCIRGIVNGHLPHFAECELMSRIDHLAGPKRPSSDFDGCLE